MKKEWNLIMTILLALLIGLAGCGSEPDKPPITKDECVIHTVGDVDFYMPNNLEYQEGLSIDSAHVFTGEEYYVSIGHQEDHYDMSESGADRIKNDLGNNADVELTQINGMDCIKASYSSDADGKSVDHRLAYFDVGGKTYVIIVSWNKGNYQNEFDAITNFSIGK